MPSTSQVTAVLATPFTDAMNCCVPKSGTVAALGNTVTAVGATGVTTGVVVCDDPAQPHNKPGMQLRARNDAQRMKILVEGRCPFSKAGIKGWTAPRYLPIKLDYVGR
jgi:hypothetical protein